MVNTKVQLQQGATKVQHGVTVAAAGVSSAAQAAGHSAAEGMQSAAANMNAGLRASTLSARSWAAPRLENAAKYTTSTMAPAVSDAVVKTIAPKVAATLRSTARQVRPQKQRSALRSTLTWTALVAAALAGAGAAGTLAWRRYRAAMNAETSPDTAGSKADQNIPPNGTAPAADSASTAAKPASSTR